MTTKKSPNQRLERVDQLKYIGIIAVILGHIASPLSKFIFSWHMPLFFLMSGFFFSIKTPLFHYILKNFKRLMTPYFFFGIAGIGLEFLKRNILGTELLDIGTALKGLVVSMDGASLMGHYGFVLRFLPALFIGRILLYLLVKYIKNIFFQIILVLCCFVASFLITMPFGGTLGLNALLRLYIGYLFFTKVENKNKSKFALFISILIPILYLTIGIPKLDIANLQYSNRLITIIWALGICSILFFITYNFHTYLGRLPFVELWSKNTMLLFILHPYTNNLAYLIESYYPNQRLMKLAISLILLHFILLFKEKCGERIMVMKLKN